MHFIYKEKQLVIIFYAFMYATLNPIQSNQQTIDYFLLVTGVLTVEPHTGGRCGACTFSKRGALTGIHQALRRLWWMDGVKDHCFTSAKAEIRASSRK